MTNTLLIKDAMAMTSKSPLTQIESAVVCTKDKFYIVPKKSTGNFVIFNTVKRHSFFEGTTIEDGLKNLMDTVKSETELHETLSELLENNAQYIHDINAAPKKSIKGFLGKKTLTIRDGRTWTSFSPKGKEATKALVQFYDF